MQFSFLLRTDSTRCHCLCTIPDDCTGTIEGYSVHLEIIKNESLDWETYETVNFVDNVEFGEWVENDTLELKIINQNPDIMAYIKFCT